MHTGILRGEQKDGDVMINIGINLSPSDRSTISERIYES